MADADYSDFLSRTGAGDGKPDYAGFLARTGAVAAPEKPVDGHYSAGADNEYGITEDPQQFNDLKPGEAAKAVDRIVQAGARGYTDTQPIFTPQMQAMVDQGGPVGRYITNPLIHTLGAVPAGFNALAAAGGQAITEGAQAAGQPALGRDLNMLAQVAPVVHFAAGSPMPGARLPGGPATADAPRFVGERTGEVTPADTVAAPLPQEFRDNPMAPGAVNRLAAPPDTTPTMTIRAGEPATQSVGAAASREGTDPARIDMTPAEVQAYRGTAEGDKLIESQQPGVADTNAYVPGVSASTAEIEQTVNAAREAKTANIAHPEVSQEAKEMADANNTVRRGYFQSTSKSGVDVINAVAARKAMVEKDYPTAFAGAKAADVAPVVEEIQTKLDDPRGKQNTQLKAYVKPLIDRLVNEDGSPKITDPQELYGFREDLNRMRSKASQAKDQNLAHVSGELGDIIAATDKAIEAAAPGYRNYMDNYAAASRKIDEMQVLQGHEAGLFDSQGRMQLSRVQTMMRNIVDSRKSDSLNPYKSISEDNMQRLWNLRDDLRRSASAQELARTPGSDTSQTMFDLAKQGLAAGGSFAAHVAAHKIAPIAGPIVLNAIKGGIANRRAATAQRAGVAKGLNNLNPNRLIAPQD